jgi:hypothetical protein
MNQNKKIAKLSLSRETVKQVALHVRAGVKAGGSLGSQANCHPIATNFTCQCMK